MPWTVLGRLQLLGLLEYLRGPGARIPCLGQCWGARGVLSTCHIACLRFAGRCWDACSEHLHKSKSLRWKSPACIKERLSTSAHTSQSLTKKREKRETTETNKDPAGCQPCDPACA